MIEFIHQLGWVPQTMFMAGVGVNHQDASDFHETFPDAKIYGWEPNPHSFCGLLTFPGVLSGLALGNAPTEFEKPHPLLYYHHSWKNGSSLLEPHEKSKRLNTQSVSVETLDLCEKNGRFEPGDGLLWLDVEGYELQVLQGAENFIKRIKAVNVEMTGMSRGAGWSRSVDVHKWLTEHGFLQSYVHTIRTVRCQFDAIYLRREIFKPELCSIMDSVLRF